jgi:hypothetical protein
MTSLFFEVRTPAGWIIAAVQSLGDPPVSLSHNHKDGRDVYIAQVHADHATLSQLPGGIDITEGRNRIIDEEEIKRAVVFKRIEIGESTELMLKSDAAPAPRHVRFRLLSADQCQENKNNS